MSNSSRLPTSSLFLLALCVGLLASACGRTDLLGRCAVDSDCADGRVCAAGFCTPPEECVGEACPPTGCEVDADCPDGEACVDSICEPGGGTNNVINNPACFENDEGICVRELCGADEGCTTQVCDLACPPDQSQRGCECVDLTCSTDDECDGDFVCFDSACVECVVDPHCADDQVCQNNKCVSGAECRTDADCAPDERCAGDDTCRPRAQCVFDDDCRAGEACFNGRCTVSPECQVDLDCPTGMECVGGNCFLAICRGPEDCENGQLCDAGECVQPPVVIECQVATPSQSIVENQRVPLEAFAYGADGMGVAATFVWTSSNSGVARVIPGPTALGGATAGSATLTATLANGQACDGGAVLTNPGPVPMNQIRVSVRDAESGAGVPGAQVRIGNTVIATDMTGLALLPDPATSAYEVSVFHDDFNWLTVQSVSSRDIRLPLLRRSGTGPVAGFTGEFDTSGLHSTGNITLGLAGASLAGGIMELSLDRLLGDNFVSPLSIPGVVDTEIPVPGGLIAYGGALGINVDLKRTYYAQSSGGPRIAWGLAGLLPFTELLSFFQGDGFGGEDVLAQLLPLFNRFDHGAYPVVLNERPRVVDTNDIDGDGNTVELLPDYNAFPEINLRPATRQNLVTDVGVSNFPILDGERSSLAILVGGVVLPSPGYIPTGISAIDDEDGDGRPDMRRLSIAPAYGALVGGRYAIVAITFAGGGGGGAGPGGFSLPEEFSVAFWNGQSFPTALSLGTFPDESRTTLVPGQRSVTVAASAGPMYRVRMVGNDRSWDVWSLGAPGMAGQFDHTVVVPAAPAGRPDLFTNGKILVDAIQTNANVDDLVGASGIGLTNAGLVSTAYNRTAAR